MPKLKALTIKNLPNGNHADGGNLYLRVAGGSRTYSFRYQRNGRKHWLAIGRQADWGLAEARAKALEYRRMLSEGRDPRAEKKAAKAATAGRSFSEVAAEFIASHRAGWKNAKHADQWENTLAQHAAALMPMPVAKIGLNDVLACLKPIWTPIPETASRLRGRIESILSYAIARGWRTEPNVAAWKGSLKPLLPARGKIAAVVHQPALAWRELPAAVARLAATGGTAAQCARFIALTACRQGEARGATWGEINLESRLWIIPSARMKAGKAHRVPLSDAALEILRALLPFRQNDNSLVFPGRKRGAPLSDVGVSKAFHAAVGNRRSTLHGLRSSFRDWASETSQAPREVCEAALAHTIRDKVEAAYARSDLLEPRRALMETWGNFCHPPAQP